MPAWRFFAPSTRTLLGGCLIAVILVGCSAASGGSDDDATERGTVVEAYRPQLEHSADVVVLAIVGDGGELNDDTLEVAALLDSIGADAVFTVGDNDYSTEGRTVAAYEESVGDVYGAWLASSAFYPIPGDHDYGDQCDDPEADADLNAYLDFFELPSGPADETYYEIRLGDVHVFAMDSLVDCHRDGGDKLLRQRFWLAEQASESDAELKIALMHNPPYSSGLSHGSFEDMRWDFADWGIDVVVAGDDHIYERSTHDGVMYLVNGLGGVEAHELGEPIDGSEVLFADAFGAVLVTSSAVGTEIAFVTVDGDVIDRTLLRGDRDALPSAAANADQGASLPVTASWYWQLEGSPTAPFIYDVYDVDLFDIQPQLVEDLHTGGRTVICYFSAGSLETWRPDAELFAAADLGAPLDGWDDEVWLDVRSSSLRPIIEQRLDKAAALGCDGVEPDNVDGYQNDSGFDLTADDQLDFNRFLAQAAHQRSLLVGLKNDVDQIDQLVDSFDFAVNEQCHEFDECGRYAPFVEAGKPVFNAEYADEFLADPAGFCADAHSGVRTLLLPLDLDGSFRISCDELN